MRLEGEDAGRARLGPGLVGRGADQLRVAGMDTIEIADGDDAAPERRGQRLRILEQLHGRPSDARLFVVRRRLRSQ